MPEGTLDAVADQGQIGGDSVTGAYDDAVRVMAALAVVGVDHHDVVSLLECEGMQKFTDACTRLLECLGQFLAGSRSGG